MRVMLVTPDRDLARRVSTKLRRWEMIVDDSGGIPFANSPCGTYLRLVARWLTNTSDAVALMAMLRHPLFGGGMKNKDRIKAVNALDLALRGLQPQSGVKGLKEKVSRDNRRAKTAAPLVEALSIALAQWPESNASFSDRYETHLRIAEQLASTSEEPGAKRLWRGEDGETGAESLSQIAPSASAISSDIAEDYPDIFDQLVAGATVRRHGAAHPRVAILGPLEARLQQADLVILGGLNEGVWPRDAAIDPFLSRPMRSIAGLPSPEQRIGLAAHDFAQLTAAPAVTLTRATRVGGKPAKPSRWIVRLKNILAGANALDTINKTHHYQSLARKLDQPGKQIEIQAPCPRPPVETRPKKFFVTRIEKLLRDPYAIYARSILRLQPLENLNEAFGNRHMGNLMHKVFEEYAKAEPPATTELQITKLHAIYAQHSLEYGLNETIAPFWQERVAAAFEWFTHWDAERRRQGEPIVIEGKGRRTFPIDGYEFELAAKADRIDRLENGGAYIIDYKTGLVPSLRQQGKFSPQLPLTGVITRLGGFELLGAGPVHGLAYLRTLGRKGKNDDVIFLDDEASQAVDEAEAGFVALMRHFLDPMTPYVSQPRPQYMDDFGDYDHLARRRERGARGSDDDSGGGSS